VVKLCLRPLHHLQRALELAFGKINAKINFIRFRSLKKIRKETILKIWAILLAALPSLYSLDATIGIYLYVVKLNLVQTFWISLGLGLLFFNLCYFFAEGLTQLLKNWFHIGGWLGKKQNSAHSWIKWCRRNHHWKLFAAGAITHPLVGVAIQKFFRFKKGYWWLFFGTAMKPVICIVFLK
jgi:hypothetical protein